MIKLLVHCCKLLVSIVMDFAARKYLVCFSIPRNWILLRAPGAEGPEDRYKGFTSLYGIKAMLCILTMAGHTLVLSIVFIDNPRFMEIKYKNIGFQFLLNGVLIVQAFFVMSGLLLSYNFQTESEKRRVTWSTLPKRIATRWMRCTPPYAVLLAYVCTWSRFNAFGPVKQLSIMEQYEDCNKYWWQHLLYIQNLFKIPQQCMGHTWYLAVDNQMHIVGLVICMACKSGRSRVKALATLLLVALVIPPVVIYFKDLDSVLVFPIQSVLTAFKELPTFVHLYTQTYGNAFNHLVGVALGLIVYEMQMQKFDVQKYKKYRILYWSVLVAIMAVILLGTIFYDQQPRRALYLRMLYGIMAKPLFGILFAILLAGTIFNYEDFYRGIVQWDGWTTLGRLSYCAYLSHVIFLYIFVANAGVAGHASLLQMLREVTCCVATSFIASLFLWLLVETPFHRVTKLLTNSINTTSAEKHFKTTIDKDA